MSLIKEFIAFVFGDYSHIGEREEGQHEALDDIAELGVHLAFRRLKDMAKSGHRSEAFRLGYSEAVMRAQLGADYIRRKGREGDLS